MSTKSDTSKIDDIIDEFYDIVIMVIWVVVKSSIIDVSRYMRGIINENILNVTCSVAKVTIDIFTSMINGTIDTNENIIHINSSMNEIKYYMNNLSMIIHDFEIIDSFDDRVPILVMEIQQQ